jgi:hypothetical protein
MSGFAQLACTLDRAGRGTLLLPRRQLDQETKSNGDQLLGGSTDRRSK